MLKTTDLKPLQRQALLAALESPQRRFRRTCRGYLPDAPHSDASGSAQAFTTRVMLSMERDYLVRFDDPRAPMRAELTSTGIRLAEQLRTAQCGGTA
jgi:hypothetical protein